MFLEGRLGGGGGVEGKGSLSVYKLPSPRDCKVNV